MLGLRRANRELVQVELLTREGCHLCDEALRVAVAVFGRRNVRALDIGSNRQLEEEYVFRIPVLRFGPHVLAEGIITRADARDAQRRALMLSQASKPAR